MDISTFYAVTSAACFALVGLWWSVAKDKAEWHTNEAKKTPGGRRVRFVFDSSSDEARRWNTFC